MNGIIARVQLKSFHLFLQQFPFERCTARCRRALRKYMTTIKMSYFEFLENQWLRQYLEKS